MSWASLRHSQFNVSPTVAGLDVDSRHDLPHLLL